MKGLLALLVVAVVASSVMAMEADVDMDKPHRKAKTSLVRPTVLKPHHLIPKNRVVIVPKGHVAAMKAREAATAAAAAAAAVPGAVPAPASPVSPVLKAATPNAACTAIKGSCVAKASCATATNTIVSGKCPGATYCCVPKAATPAVTPTTPATPVTPVTPWTAGSDLTAAQLKAIMVSVSCKDGKKDCGLAAIPESRATSYIAPLNAAMKEFGITSCARISAFLANVAQESNNLLYMKELASGAEYEGNKGLGNTQRGDGVRFKGRGPIQITGRYNYGEAKKGLGVDVVANPALLEGTALAFRGSCWFWSWKGLNTKADPNTEASFQDTVRVVNGAIVTRTRYPNRKAIWLKAKAVLGC